MAGRFLLRHREKGSGGRLLAVANTTRAFVVHDDGQLSLRLPVEFETDEKRLKQRMKQVAMGKESEVYQRYIKAIPKHKRRRRGRIPVDPCTPDIRQKCSKRSWDGQVKAWRRQLHQFFTNQDAPAEASSEGNANLPKQTDQNEKENMPNNHQKQQPMGIPGAEYILDTEEAFPAVADPSASMGFFA
mmetsp:Transcript_5094/g.13305  ORF Transcript_5094/g.13305 Transcript_5094/m.13305 type:complete len:187 (-) Transcript_5094:86-646(-)